MYVPNHFAATDPRDAWTVIQAHGFATLVTYGPGGAPVASPLPFLARPEHGRDGAVIGHMARVNPQLRHLETAASDALVVFQGPAAFVSAACYAGDDAIPTWDHVTVHVTGRPEVLDEDATLQVLAETVAHFEAQARTRWRLDTDDPYVRELSRHVVGFRIEATRIEASFKLSQNLPELELHRVVAWLLDSGQPAVAEAVARRNAVDLPCAAQEVR
jgi:transcriptional regulator